jgi:hypothetical protein
MREGREGGKVVEGVRGEGGIGWE